MKQSISILGSTGSIGRQTLDVAEQLGIKVLAISADKNIQLLENQVRKFRPALAAVYDETAARDFKLRVRDLSVKVATGSNGLIEAAGIEGAETVVTAVVGTVGLLPTLAAIRLGRRIALANKETLVCAGELVMNAARKYGAEIIPVDSEHSALYQCLQGEYLANVQNIILTASGGPFLGKNRSELSNVTAEMALKHPNWNMGKKITIDSATLMNKGLEIIEAVHLFGIPPSNIKVVVHPESIIHSMVEYCDNSVIAQLSEPDMRLPIQYALTYPKRISSPVQKLDFIKRSSLTFLQPDLTSFPCLKLAMDTVKISGTACAVLNGANEAAVDLFLQHKLSFYGIHQAVLSALMSVPNVLRPSLGDILTADEVSKEFVYANVKLR